MKKYWEKKIFSLCLCTSPLIIIELDQKKTVLNARNYFQLFEKLKNISLRWTWTLPHFFFSKNNKKKEISSENRMTSSQFQNDFGNGLPSLHFQTLWQLRTKKIFLVENSCRTSSKEKISFFSFFFFLSINLYIYSFFHLALGKSLFPPVTALVKIKRWNQNTWKMVEWASQQQKEEIFSFFVFSRFTLSNSSTSIFCLQTFFPFTCPAVILML